MIEGPTGPTGPHGRYLSPGEQKRLITALGVGFIMIVISALVTLLLVSLL